MDSSAKAVFLCHGRLHLKYKEIGGIKIPSKVWINGFYVDKNYLSFPDYVGELDTIPQDIIAENSMDAVFMIHPPSNILPSSPLLISKVVNWLKPGGLFVAPYDPYITTPFINTRFERTISAIAKHKMNKYKKSIMASQDPALIDVLLDNKKKRRIQFENWVRKHSNNRLKVIDVRPLDPEMSKSNMYVFQRV
jgi:hypothetical protein